MLSMIVLPAMLFASTLSAAALPSVCGKTCPRVPPTLGSQSADCYVPAPEGFEYGHFHRNYQSFGGNATQRNIEILAYPGENTTVKKVDFITYQTLTSDTIYSQYGLELASNYTDVKIFQGTGTIASVSGPLEITAYGYDTACDAYVMYYEPGPTGAFGLTIISASATGPSEKTYADLIAGVKALGVDDLTEQADAMAWIPYDGARATTPYPACDEACLTNNNNPSM